MKRLLSIVMIVALFLFVACDSIIQDGSITSGAGNTPQGTTPSVRRNGVTFDFSGAKAVAQLEKTSSTSRAVTNADSLGDFVKILADGTMENAITVAEGTTLSNIIGVYKSPLENSQDVFIAFSDTSTIGYDENTYEYNYLGPLICVHQDGSIADILKTGNSYMFKQSSISFDANGNLYFITFKNGGQVIYQFDPTDDSLTEMVAAVEGTEYTKMQISEDGQWIFASGSRSSTYFLRAIPVNNPNSFVNVYYSSNNEIGTNKWVYDDIAKTIYFIVQDGKNSGLFTATEAGGFRDKTFVRNRTLTGVEDYEPDELFKSFYSDYSEFSWDSELIDDNDNFSAEKLMECLIQAGGYYVYRHGQYYYLPTDGVDIRFDAFSDEEGALKVLSLLTDGKKNEEALNALDCFAGKAAMRYISDNYYNLLGYNYSKDGYERNFISEILYVKDTDTLVKDYDDVIFSYDEVEWDSETGSEIYHHIDVLGTDFFQKNSEDYYISGGVAEWCYFSDYCESNPICYEFTKTPTEILQYFFSFCNVVGEKEFRLTSFKNDKTYGDLYTNKTDEEALEWLEEDAERLSLFVKAMVDGDAYFGQYTDSYYVERYRKQIAAFLANTCFIKGTDDKAITTISNNSSVQQISYNPWSWDCGGLSVTDNGIWYEYSNLNNWGVNTEPFYYIVHVADSDGTILENVKKIDMPEGKVVGSQKYGNRMFLKYALVDNDGTETGFQHIYSVKLDSGDYMNHFENVANSNMLEVISYSVGGDNLYFSAVRGTTVENQIVDINTNECNPLGTNRKMVAVYSF